MAVANPTKEEWRAVPGWEGFYEVSNLGRVRSLDRTVPRRCGPNPFMHLKGKILSPSTHDMGYLGVGLYRLRRPKCIRVHTLVASAFIRPLMDGEEVDHINFDRKDNRVENLRIVTPSVNVQHSYDAGRMPRGESRWNAKLTPPDIFEIRRRCETGETQSAIARDFGITPSHVSMIRSRRHWSHL